MLPPDHDEAFYACCATGYAEVKYINQMLSWEKSTSPIPACLVVDLGNGADLEEAGINPKLLAQRMGTPKFIARSVSLGKPLPWDSNATGLRSMPVLEGRALELYESIYGEKHYRSVTQSVQKMQEEADNTSPKFTHRLFHDAESVFWVIAWSLACSAGPGYMHQNDIHSPSFVRFISTMKSHQAGDDPDSRDSVTPRILQSEWEEILHPDLREMASMLTKMSWYVFPEWSFRTELVDDEHVHEALMRLLLTEIVRISNGANNIELQIGIRWLPNAKAPNTF